MLPLPGSPVKHLHTKTLVQPDLRLETRVERDGKVTYHQVTNDSTSGLITENVYDQDRRLIRVLKRAPGGSRTETYFDPASGQPRRVNEAGIMPDGNTLSRDLVYYGSGRASEVVTIVSPRGCLVRITERQQVNGRNTFQGETSYNTDGTPANTTNQHMKGDNGALVHREQIWWLAEGQRAMTEHLYFDNCGQLTRYVKVLHYASGGSFSEETQDFHPLKRCLVRRELVAYSPNGCQTCIDVLFYDDDGQVHERQSTFFDELGKPIAYRTAGDTISPN